MANQFSGTDLSKFDAGDDRQDDLFDVLSHQHRRFILHALRTAEMPVPVGELATELVAWEVQRPVSDRSGDDRDAIEVSLVHTHLPKMADAGLIKYNVTGQIVTLADRSDEIQTHLQPLMSETQEA